MQDIASSTAQEATEPVTLMTLFIPMSSIHLYYRYSVKGNGYNILPTAT